MRTRSLYIVSFVLWSILIGAQWVRADVEIIGPDEVLQQIVIHDGLATFHAEGRTWELVTNVAAPGVSSLGDGEFHPWDAREVEVALAALRGADRLPDARIYILPYPRREILKSSCHGSSIFLSPGIREVSVEHLHMTVAHEMGHIVQHERVPVGSPQWDAYIARRNLDPTRFHAGAIHRDRPSEIFSEDFRYLMGGDLAVRSGTIENPEIATPDLVPGLRVWFQQVLRAPRTAAVEPRHDEPRSFPNPFAPTSDSAMRIHFARPERADASSHADVFDLNGRLVRSLHDASAQGDDVVFRWDGRDRAGHRASSGVYFVRWSEHPELGAARVQVLH